MPIDLMIVDDHELVRNTTEQIAKKMYGLNVLSFSTGLDGLMYLANTKILPTGYLIDMCTADPSTGCTQELESPYKIFRYLKEKNQVEFFRFYTGHLSEYDSYIITLTRAKVIIKSDQKDLFDFLQELRNI